MPFDPRPTTTCRCYRPPWSWKPGAVVNSGLFFWWFINFSNGRNVTGQDVLLFPFGEMGANSNALANLNSALMEDYKQNSFIRKRIDCEFQEFRPSRSKTLIDAIDVVLGDHFGFTQEEIDYIINYDIKYRMGLSGAEVDADD
jgi:hypothetical protein